jgi:hypothetical protein
MAHLAHIRESAPSDNLMTRRKEPLARAAALSLLALAVAWSFRGTFGKPDCQDLDFGSYYRAGRAVARGETPYMMDAHGPLGVYPYAPAYAYLFAPLSCLDYFWACRVWLAINWLVTLACVVLALDLVFGPRGPERWPVGLLALAPTAAYFWANVRVGQVGALMLLGCLAWAVCRLRGRPFVGGLALASACALKLAPGLLVVYLALRRDLRGLAGVLVGGAALFLLPAAWVGAGGTVRLHAEWIRHTAATHVAEQTFRPGNQSLLAQLARLPAVSDGHTLHSRENLETLYRLYPVLVLALAAGIFLWIIRDARMARAIPAEGQRRRENLHFALLLVFLTLAHPRAWRCNLVALLVPCVLLAEHVWHRRRGFRVALAALVVIGLACVWPTAGVGVAGWGPGAWLLLGKHFWAAALAAAACAWSLREPRSDRGVVVRPAALRGGLVAQGPEAHRPGPLELAARRPLVVEHAQHLDSVLQAVAQAGHADDQLGQGRER